MKPKPISRPPSPRRVPKRMPPRRTVIRARAASADEDFDDYESESEPNMKLSHAFIVVLALHVLAVGGVFAFNSLKVRPATRESAALPTVTTKAAQPEPKVETTSAAAHSADKAVLAKGATDTAAPTHVVVAGETLTKIAAAHKVSVQEIERLNGLSNGAMLRVGQALKLPGAVDAAKSAPETKPSTVSAKPAPQPQAASAKTEKVVPPKSADKPVATKTADAKAATETKVAADAKVAAAKPAVETPKPAEATPPAPAPKVAQDNSAAAEKSYVVAKGDNPYSIAKKLKVKAADLLKANNIEDPTKLQIGQKLVVP